jgi:hypothetical protein
MISSITETTLLPDNSKRKTKQLTVLALTTTVFAAIFVSPFPNAPVELGGLTLFILIAFFPLILRPSRKHGD